MSSSPNFHIPSSFSINDEEKEETDNDRAITVEKIKCMLYDLFEIAGFDKVGLGLNEEWEKDKTDKWGYSLANMVQVSPAITMDKSIKRNLKYPPGPYPEGWPAQWKIVERYLGGNHGDSTSYQGNKNIPDFLIGEYVKSNWEEEYETRLTGALLKAMSGDKL